MAEDGQTPARSGIGVRAPQDMAAGAFLIALALFAFWQAYELPVGTLRSIGPGMLPRAVATLIGLGGVGLVVSSFLSDGPALERWHWRGPFFILGGILLFAATIRTLGLAFAGPLAMFFGSLGSDEFRWKESLIFSLILTALCILLFKFALRLPIPVIAFM